MIGKLKGIVDSLGEDWVILDVQGVGYQVHCSAKTMGTLPPINDPATLSIETHVRETEIKLYGFTHDLEREWFRLLQTVQGVGAKVALAVLGTLSPSDLASAIALQDKAMIARTPGIGPKVAQRMVLELKNKVPALSGDATGTIGLQQELGEGVAATGVQDAVSALTNLGYSADQASRAVASVLSKAGDDADSGTLIRMGLKELSS